MLKILIIDDEEDIRNLLSLYLTTAGYDVVTAKDGEEGLRRFEESSFDAVITDLLMPKCNGDEVARHVRNTGKNIPVIGVTGTPWDIDRTCFDIVISKPFTYQEFKKCIKEVINTGGLKNTN